MGILSSAIDRCISSSSTRGAAMFRRCAPWPSVLLLAIVATSVEQVVAFQQTAGTLSAARYHLAATSVGSKVIFAGGAPSGAAVDIYDATTDAWSTQTLQPARIQIAATTFGNRAFFAGGNYYSNTHYDDVNVFDESTGGWSIYHLSVARSSLAAVSVGNKVVFAGGWTGNGYNSKVVDILDTDTNQWSRATLASLGGETIGAAVGTKALFHSNNGTLIDIYDSVTHQWSTTNFSHWRDGLAVTTVGDRVLFAGGWDDVASSLVDIYDATTNQWSTANLSQARSKLAATTVGHWALFAGGYGNSSVVDIYDSDTGLWTVEHLSTGRSLLAATALGNQAFFGGGRVTPTGASSIVDIFTVPEPSTLALLGVGAIGLLAFAWRRWRKLHNPRSMVLAAMVVVLTAMIVSVTQADVFKLPDGQTSLETVAVGNPGNANDTTGYGGVGYVYQMGKYEVTNTQYCRFLNDVLPTINDSESGYILPNDTYGLYNTAMETQVSGGINYDPGAETGTKFSVKPEYGNRPVVYVSWYDGIRFANWLQNGQDGGTENGTYTITGGGQHSGTVAIPDAANRATWTADDAHWVLPSENEWYKAAYHKNDGVTANYWLYPTSTNDVPINVLTSPDPGNNGNFYDYLLTGTRGYTTSSPYLTTVGAFSNSDSPYGTFDQGGNVWEWNETFVMGVFGPARVFRGGSWGDHSNCLASVHWSYVNPTYEYAYVGFRVASVPEPGSIMLLFAEGLCWLAYAWRWRQV
jgi:formylglycine-generating enzyme